MIDESAKRRETFDEGNSVGVVLADGQTWLLPKPWLEIRPTFKGGRAVGNYPVHTYGPEIEGLVDAIADCEDSLLRLSGIATLAAYLLTRHYDLVDAELDQLLCFRVNDEASTDWARATIDVATGRNGPKRSRAGGD